MSATEIEPCVCQPQYWVQKPEVSLTVLRGQDKVDRALVLRQLAGGDLVADDGLDLAVAEAGALRVAVVDLALQGDLAVDELVGRVVVRGVDLPVRRAAQVVQEVGTIVVPVLPDQLPYQMT
jgi:hypothetical protein